MRAVLLVAVVVALGAASSASAAAPGASGHRGDPLCQLVPWLPWCHHHGDECDDRSHGHRHHHPHHDDCETPGSPGGPAGPAGPGAPGGADPGGTGPTGSGTPAPIAPAPGGTPAPGGPPGTIAADTRAPSFLAKPRLHPTRFRAARGRGASIAARTGTTIVYRLSEPARVFFTVQKNRSLTKACRRKLAARNSRHRTGLKCKRWISLKGRFAKASVAGPNSIRFTGRLKRRPLQPGSYRLVITARDAAGNTRRPKRPKFRIVR